MYDPIVGRFTTVDPAGQFWSSYVGMGNNPVIGIDPTGGICPTCPEGSQYDAYRNAGQSFGYETGVGVFNNDFNIVVLGSRHFDVQKVGVFDGPLTVGNMLDMQSQLADVEAMMSTFNPDNVAMILMMAEGGGGGGESNGVRGAANIAARGSKAVKTGLSNAQLVQRAATKAEAAIGGTGRFAGTAKHTYANNLLRRYQGIHGDRGLRFNQYFNNNPTLGPGNRGFLDVLDMRNSIIYDFKFGNATWRAGQLQKYQRNFLNHSTQIIRP